MNIDAYRFCVIGPGRLGSTLLAGLLEAGLTVTAVGVHADDDTSLFGAIPHVRVRDAALEADAWWLTVPDDEIYAVAGRLAAALPAMPPRGGAAAARHPLQRPRLDPPAQATATNRACACSACTRCRRSPASRDAELLRDVPCAVTAHEERDLQLGEELAGRLGMRPFRLADEQKTAVPPRGRRSAATCWSRSRARPSASWTRPPATPRGLDHLAALLETTLENLLQSGEPAHALTGPVARGDVGTVRAHLRLLDRESPRLARTYRALTLEALALAAPRLDDEQVTTLQQLLGAGEAGGERRRPGRPAGAPSLAGHGPEASRDRHAHHRRDAGRAARAAAPARLRAHHGRPARRPPEPRRGGAGTLRDRRRLRLRQPDAVRPRRGPRARTRATRRATCACSRRRGVDVVFAPAADEMYPEGFATSVHVGGPLTESFEGASRPGHFDGVAIVVTKLLDIVQPDVLFLGQKDAQQLAVVRRLVRDLDLPVEVAGVPTVREPDGLAMSSRNAYLTPEQRAAAPDLYRALLAGARRGRQSRARRQGRSSSRAPTPRSATCASARPGSRPDAAPSPSPRFDLDYLAVVDADTFVPEEQLGPRSLLVAAARLGATRLIDNLSLAAPAAGEPTSPIVTQRVPRQGRDRLKGRTTMATVIVNGKKQAHVREGLVCVVTGSIEFSSHGDADIIKITDEVSEAVRQTGLSDGTVTVFVPGATGALTTLEYEPGVVEDVQQALDVVAPADRFYQHNVNLGDGNGHSHVRAGLVGPSLTVPFVDGRLTLGRYQNIVFCDFDARPRERSVVVQVMGV